MLKNWIVPTLLLIGCSGVSQAHPLDAPGTVYIDGLPCNTACQSYMRWSRQYTSLITAPAQINRRSSYAIPGAAATHQKTKRVLQARVSGQRVPLPPPKIAQHPSVGTVSASEVERADVPASLSTVGVAAAARSKTIQEQVAAATAFAEQVTTAAAVESAAHDVEMPKTSTGPEGAHSADTEKSTLPPPKKTDDLVALVMARPEIKTVADLAGKDIAVTERQSESTGLIRTAIAAQGAIQVQLSPGHIDPIDRLIGGEVPAAILALVSSEAAEWFPGVKGFKIYRVPISSR
jgi:hypothetical protein